MVQKNNMLSKAALYVIMIVLLEATLLVLPISLNTAYFMFVPFLAAILTMLLAKEVLQASAWKSLSFHSFEGRSFIVGLLTPMLLIGCSYVIVWCAGWGSFGTAPEYSGRAVELVIQFIVMLIGGAVTVVLGEEFGWRGYLLPRLTKLGMRKALIWSSIIWGLFHLPIMFFTDLYHSDVNLYVYIPLFMANIVLAGIFIGYLRLKSRSIWPALIAHSAHNLAWQYGDLFTQNQTPIVKYMTGDAGILLILGYALALFIIVRKDAGMASKKEIGSLPAGGESPNLSS